MYLADLSPRYILSLPIPYLLYCLLFHPQPDSGSEPEELLEDVSDKIDEVLLSRLQPSSLSSAGSAISKLAVYVAKYNYDPYVDSPNDNPDSELPLKAGDYIYVYGDPDEVGHLIRPCGP